MFNAGIISARTVSGGGESLTDQVKAMFSGGVLGGMWDLSDMSTLAQDSAGVTAVTAYGQPVGRALDLSGNGNHLTQSTTAARPAFVGGVGGNVTRFDGVDDILNMPSGVYGILSSPTVATIIMGGYGESSASNLFSVIYESQLLIGVYSGAINVSRLNTGAGNEDLPLPGSNIVGEFSVFGGRFSVESIHGYRQGSPASTKVRTSPVTGITAANTGIVRTSAGAGAVNRSMIIGRPLTDSEFSIAAAWAAERIA